MSIENYREVNWNIINTFIIYSIKCSKCDNKISCSVKEIVLGDAIRLGWKYNRVVDELICDECYIKEIDDGRW